MQPDCVRVNIVYNVVRAARRVKHEDVSTYCYFFLLDIDECSETPMICGAGAACINQEGNYTCECVVGFEMVNGTCLGKDFIFFLCYALLIRLLLVLNSWESYN